MKKIMYIMRHGQTLFNVRKKIQGFSDSPLTEDGIRQATIAKEYFKNININFAYSSTSERASDTLEIITSMKYERLKGLKEMNFGLYEGESEDLNPKSEIFENFFLDYGGESRNQVKLRLKETCIEIMERKNHDSVLIVSHAGACFHFLRNWEDPSILKNGLPNCTIFKYEYENKKFNLLEVFYPEF